MEKIIINRKKVHHGMLFGGKVSVFMTGTDYFIFSHDDCKEKKNERGSPMFVEEVTQCHGGRIILHIICLNCGFRDAAKPLLYEKEEKNIKVVKCKRD